MKVGVWLNEELDNTIGGGFSYVEKLVKLIDERRFSKELEIVFLTRKPLKSSYKKEVVTLHIKSDFRAPRPLRLFIKLSGKMNLLSSISERFKNKIKLNIKEKEHFELKYHNIDVIYYLFQSMQSVQDYPFITTNWDVGHLSIYAFPEVNDSIIFKKRERWYNSSLKRAVSIFAESDSGKKELINYLNINPDRIKVAPIFAGNVVSLKVATEKQNDVLNKLGLVKNEFFFYPAQFWAHKNHYNLIKGFKIASLEIPNLKLVFTGSDKGNLAHIMNLIKQENLSEKVICLGFVELDEMFTLYKNTISLVMPTFLGPTNMPLLEARDLDCPVICSDIEGHREQLGKGAVYFNPLSSKEIYDAMIKMIDKNFRLNLLNSAQIEKATSKFDENVAMDYLENNLIEVSHYRNCWD